MSEPSFCSNHPNVETYLRCNRCDKLICPKCAEHTDVGYRCRSCIGAHQQVYFAGFSSVHYLVAAAVSLPLSIVAGWLIPSLSWFAFFLSPLAGTGVAEIARRAIRKRRGPHTWLVVCGCIVVGWLGSALFWLIPAVAAFFEAAKGANWLHGLLLPAFWNIVYVVTAASAAYYRLRPGRRI
ncbi:MAG: hypothetical protein E3J64_07180 [Anaerolineales bacterium]|nr:MAG: hypothetical protein E3J64_07180 [Anaerolineales bacterium]